MFKRKNKANMSFNGAPAVNTRRKSTIPAPQMNAMPEPERVEPEEIKEQEYRKFYNEPPKPKQEEVKKTIDVVVEEPVNREKESTIITKVTVIKGDLNVDDNMTIYGEVNGNVSCGGELRVYGMIRGDISTQHFFAKGAEINGDLNCEGKLIIAEHTSVEGNISASSMILKGRVIGNITVEEELFFHTDCHVEGDVTASSIQMEKGTFINGHIKIINNLL